MTMLETVFKRFEDPDEVRTFEKGKFELIHIGGMTNWSGHVRTRLEVVRPCRAQRGCVVLQRRARWAGAVRLCRRCNG
jgi:hypothetical protein